MGVLRILNSQGHAEVRWELDAAKAVAEAEHIFAEHRARGYTAVRTDVSPPQIMPAWDPKADQITMVPRVAGG